MLFTKQTLPLKQTALFSGLFTDYINHHSQVQPFYKFHFDTSSFENFIKEDAFKNINRTTLVNALSKQASFVNNTSELSKANINALLNTTTYTVTTGHQLCLFTGPLYFIYKIASTINLCQTLNQNFSDKQFVPVYWMASEDHDFEEINHIHSFGKKVIWNNQQKGSVGEFDTATIAEAIAELKTILGNNENATQLIQLFENAYLKNNNLSDATRYLVNELFGEYGLVVLDGNDAELKHLFKQEFTADIFENKAFDLVNETINELKTNYSIQVNPREINVFYKEAQLRERIERDGTNFKVVNTAITFTGEQLKTLIETQPEKLSPNVVLRPLYQQKILPNIAYVGGPGELAYWLEYKKLFSGFDIPYPILTPRNFVMLIDKGTQNKMQKLNLSVTDVFRDGEELVKQFIKTQHADVHLENEKEKIVSVFTSVLDTVSQIDKTLVGSTEAEKQKALNGLTAIEQKINRALKQKSETDINQIWSIKGKLFPNNTPQERWDNFSMYYTKYGKAFIPAIMQELNYDLKSFEYTILQDK